MCHYIETIKRKGIIIENNLLSILNDMKKSIESEKIHSPIDLKI